MATAFRMSMTSESTYQSIRRTIWLYLGILIGVALLLGVLHYFYESVRVGRVYWFSLDKERNLHTWFKGTCFLLYGCAAFVAYYWERKRNAEGAPCFRLPFLWLGVGLGGIYLSLDDITILHENLFWRETREVTSKFGSAWKYLTQWEIFFAPAILITFGFYVLFFYNRLRISKGALRGALTGMGCWAVSLFLEGLRHSFKLAGERIYSTEAMIEKELQMIGAIFLLGSILFYTLDVALDFSAERRARLAQASRFLTKQALAALVAMLVVLSGLAATAFLYARKEATSSAPVPHLMRQVADSDFDGEEPLPAVEPSTSSHEIWFEDLRREFSLAMPDAEALLRSVADALPRRESTLQDVPAAVEADRQPRIVFLSVSDGKTRARVSLGDANGLRQAVERAVARMQEGLAWSTNRLWIKLDIVQRAQPPLEVRPDTNLGAPTGLEGVAFERERGFAFLPEEVLANHVINSKGQLGITAVNSYLRKRLPAQLPLPRLTPLDPIKVTRFATTSFFYDGQKPFSMYRGHREQPDISKDALSQAARDAGAYLVRSIELDGRFAYSFSPDKNEIAPTYNIVRHAGTIYSMLELYVVTRDRELLSAAEKAIQHLLTATTPYGKAEENLSIVVESGKIKLGAVALTIVALTKHAEVTQDRQHLPLIQRLGRYILTQQQATGGFISQRLVETGDAREFESQYYPGEAILALVRHHKLDPQAAWLDAAQKGAGYLINVRDKGKTVAELIHDHWLLYGLNELHRVRPDPSYIGHSMRIVQAIQAGQNRKPAFPDYLGSYYDPPRSTPAATRTEGLVAAYELARDFVSKEQAESILQTIQLTVAFQFHTQFRPESVMYFDNPQRALGAFHRGLNHCEIRIDYVQHNISALLGLRRILDEKDARGSR